MSNRFVVGKLHVLFIRKVFVRKRVIFVSNDFENIALPETCHIILHILYNFFKNWMKP